MASCPRNHLDLQCPGPTGSASLACLRKGQDASQVPGQFNCQATIGGDQPDFADQTADELEDFAAMPWLLERLREAFDLLSVDLGQVWVEHGLADGTRQLGFKIRADRFQLLDFVIEGLRIGAIGEFNWESRERGEAQDGGRAVGKICLMTTLTDRRWCRSAAAIFLNVPVSCYARVRSFVPKWRPSVDETDNYVSAGAL